MLGRTIADPDGIEGRPDKVDGLGLLEVDTVLAGDKVTTAVTGTHVATGETVEGYEIHLGRTAGPDCARPVVVLAAGPDGAGSSDGRIEGSYLHGMFVADGFRRAYLARFGHCSTLAYRAQVESALDALADHLEAHLDLDRILGIARARVADLR
jgi:adenosylcobyric acid synthase